MLIRIFILQNNFLEKNANISTKATCDICQLVCQSLGVDFDMNKKGSINKLNENSTANILQMGTNELVNKLNQTVRIGTLKQFFFFTKCNLIVRYGPKTN